MLLHSLKDPVPSPPDARGGPPPRPLHHGDRAAINLLGDWLRDVLDPRLRLQRWHNNGAMSPRPEQLDTQGGLECECNTCLS